MLFMTFHKINFMKVIFRWTICKKYSQYHHFRGGGETKLRFFQNYSFISIYNDPLLNYNLLVNQATIFYWEPPILGSQQEQNGRKCNILKKYKLNKKWMDLCTTTALKETVLISFEYYSKVPKHRMALRRHFLFNFFLFLFSVFFFSSAIFYFPWASFYFLSAIFYFSSASFYFTSAFFLLSFTFSLLPCSISFTSLHKFFTFFHHFFTSLQTFFLLPSPFFFTSLYTFFFFSSSFFLFPWRLFFTSIQTFFFFPFNVFYFPSLFFTSLQYIFLLPLTVFCTSLRHFPPSVFLLPFSIFQLPFWNMIEKNIKTLCLVQVRLKQIRNVIAKFRNSFDASEKNVFKEKSIILLFQQVQITWFICCVLCFGYYSSIVLYYCLIFLFVWELSWGNFNRRNRWGRSFFAENVPEHKAVTKWWIVKDKL